MLLERETPRSRLEAALNDARAGAGRIVSIEGEAGIGKTSLALQFVAAHREDTQVFAGGCEQLSTPEPLGPLRDIERDSKGRFSVSPASQLTTFGALLRLLTSGSAPGLLLIEDFHWADDATLDLFRYLGRRIRAARRTPARVPRRPGRRPRAAGSGPPWCRSPRWRSRPGPSPVAR